MLIDDAWGIALSAHDGQADKGGDRYISHVARVAEAVAPLGADHKVVALLHDVVEDHGDRWSLEHLRDIGLSDTQADALDAITRRPHEGYSEYLVRCSANPIAARVKYHDLLDNLNPDRLRRVPPETAKRLVAKYTEALMVVLLALHPGARV